MIFEMFRPVHRWIWCDAERRAHKLLRFGETETDGGRALVRASETTPDSLLRRLYLEHGVDDLRVDEEPDEALLAFLHLSEKNAADRFSVYRDVLENDIPTRAIFEEILRDEVFHMNYTLTQLARVSPQRHGRTLWYERLRRIWKSYLRMAAALG